MTGHELKRWREANFMTQTFASQVTGVPYGSWIRCETEAHLDKPVPDAIALAVQVVSLGFEPYTVNGKFEQPLSVGEVP